MDRNRSLAALAALSLLALLPASASLAGPVEPGDDDDGIFDVLDNCRTVSNESQCDTDFDGYGNACDGDFDQNFATNAVDFSTKFVPGFKAAAKGITDMDCNGTTNALDFSTKFVPQFKAGKPGPSGLYCAGTVPCDL